jgi:hypothetical protein
VSLLLACERVLILLLSGVRAPRCSLGLPAAASAWQRLMMSLFLDPFQSQQKKTDVSSYEKATEEEKDGGE